MKKCVVCCDVKPLGCFFKSSVNKDGYQNRCKACRPSRLKEYEKLKKETAELRDLVFEKLGLLCNRCGFSDRRALQIDHKNGDGFKDRRANSQLKFFRKVLANLEMFQILCANCNWIKRVENKEH